MFRRHHYHDQDTKTSQVFDVFYVFNVSLFLILIRKIKTPNDQTQLFQGNLTSINSLNYKYF